MGTTHFADDVYISSIGEVLRAVLCPFSDTAGQQLLATDSGHRASSPLLSGHCRCCHSSGIADLVLLFLFADTSVCVLVFTPQSIQQHQQHQTPF